MLFESLPREWSTDRRSPLPELQAAGTGDRAACWSLPCACRTNMQVVQRLGAGHKPAVGLAR